MSGGLAYVYDPDGTLEAQCNKASVEVDRVDATPGDRDDPRAPRQRPINVHDAGMGDMLRFDVERIRILIERHLLATGSARARALLDDWDTSIRHFVKVTPPEYRRALIDIEAEAMAPVTVAAE